jgi:hypothetical protein
MPYRSSKPPPCQHKPSASCTLCRREKNDLEQVGAWARESSTAMAGARGEPTDYASFVKDSSYCPFSCKSPFTSFPDALQLLSSPQPKPPDPHPPPTRTSPVTISTNHNSNESRPTSHLSPSIPPAPKHQAAASPPPAPTAQSPTARFQPQSRVRLRLQLRAPSQSTPPALLDSQRPLSRQN